MLIDKTFRELLDAFASSAPTPGGGSAAAAGAAMGVSLLVMVCGLPKTRSGSEDDRATLLAAEAALHSVRGGLIASVDADTKAYDEVVAAYRLPKGTPEEVAARKAAIQAALRHATDVPLSVARRCGLALREAAAVQAHGYAAAASDVGVAIALLRAGLEGARLNVETNLDGITDAEYVAMVKQELANLS